ncbi:MAG: nuclear transport factor 2 family protein [Acidimicrobiia bacterium]
MDQDDVVEEGALAIVQRFVGCFVAADLEGALSLLDDDVVVHECESVPYPGDYRGKAAFTELASEVRATWRFRGMPSIRFFGADGGAVAVIENPAIARATGIPVDLRFTEVYTVRRGLITSIEMFYWDTAAMAAAVSESPTSAD